MPRVLRHLFALLIVTDAIILIAISLVAADQQLPSKALASWLDGHGGAMLLPWFVGKILLIAVLLVQSGHKFLAGGWAWLGIAKLSGIHLLATPALTPHLTGLATVAGMTPALLGKLTALAAVGAVSLGLFALAASQSPSASRKQFVNFSLLGILLLVTVSALPDALARLVPESVRLIPVLIELTGETLVSSWLLATAWLLLGHNFRIETTYRPIVGRSVGRMSLAGRAASRHVAPQ